jgi:uncharacterized protein
MPQMKTAAPKNPRQAALRQRKKVWSKAASEFIKRVIGFKRGLNGRGDIAYSLPPGSITEPLPNELQSFESELASNFQQLMSEATAIEAEQAAYAAEHQQQRDAREKARQEQEPPTETPTLKPASKRQTIVKQASKKTGKVRIGEHEFDTLLALNSQEQQIGLMYKPWPPPVMSFVYARPQLNRFWMANTPSPLDIVFCLNGKITSIHEGEPYSTAGIGDYTPSDLVIELPRGTCQSLGIDKGDKVSLTY